MIVVVVLLTFGYLSNIVARKIGVRNYMNYGLTIMARGERVDVGEGKVDELIGNGSISFKYTYIPYYVCFSFDDSVVRAISVFGYLWLPFDAESEWVSGL